MNPYKVVEEDNSHNKYQYLTGYTWFTNAILLVFMLSMLYPSDFLRLLGSISLAIYYVVTMVPGRAIKSKIGTATRTNSMQESGSKVSFSNPLKYKIPKQA